MEFLSKFIFWSSICLLIYTYIGYPMLTALIARKRKNNNPPETIEADLPFVSVLMAVYNEEIVIQEKLQCLQNLNYPKDKLAVFIGSDCSSDQTNPIIQHIQTSFPQLFFHAFQERQGKPGVVNQLAQKAIQNAPTTTPHIFLMTDANVILEKNCLIHLARHFSDDEIVIVDANMVNTGMQKEGISQSENQYISSEVRLKNNESIAWKLMAGPFGGCYALRASHFNPVPVNYLVDDFYITMKVIEQKGAVINDLNAICYEAISHEIKEEFRRKARISAGNFQNLVTFPHLWWPPYRLPGFVLFSHKVLRWMGPFLIIALLMSSTYLAFAKTESLIWSTFYPLSTLGIWSFVLAIPILDNLLGRFGVHWLYFRSIRYFVLMNIALLKGFFNFLKGIKNNVWEPTKRN